MNSEKIDKNIIVFVERYQCPGCLFGSDISCYKPSSNLACEKHRAATTLMGYGKIFLGLDVGFNRVGPHEDMNIQGFIDFKHGNSVWKYNFLNVPVWKYKNEHNHTIVRGLLPRTNIPFLHIYMEDCLANIDCHEITSDELAQMD